MDFMQKFDKSIQEREMVAMWGITMQIDLIIQMLWYSLSETSSIFLL